MITLLVQTLGYPMTGLICWRRERDAWALDLGPRHGFRVSQVIRFGERGGDVAVPGILGMEPMEALGAALEAVTLEPVYRSHPVAARAAGACQC